MSTFYIAITGADEDPSICERAIAALDQVGIQVYRSWVAEPAAEIFSNTSEGIDVEAIAAATPYAVHISVDHDGSGGSRRIIDGGEDPREPEPFEKFKIGEG